MNTFPQVEEKPGARARRSHIALYMQSFTGGGAERVMVNLAQGLAERGHRVDMIVVHAEGPYRELLPPTVRLIVLRGGRSLTGLPSLIRYLRQERPDALLSAIGYSNLIALWACAAARFAGRVVVSVHLNLSMEIQNETGLKARLMPFLYRRFYGGADAVVAVSHEAAGDLAERLQLPPGQVKTIYNPVITAALYEQAQEPVEHPWFAPGEPPVVLSAGRLCPQKDFPNLLRAFAQVRAHMPSRLIILGEGPDRRMLEQMVSDLGLGDSVLLPGFAANPYAYMARAATFALSSRWEGLPTVLIEALACGAQVVSTDCPSGPHEILRGGEHGRLVPVEDSEALAQAIEASLRDGKSPASPENWRPFHVENAVMEYEKVLFND